MAGIKTQKTHIFYRTGAASTFAMARVQGVTGFTPSAGAPTPINVTDLDSDATENILGLQDNGTVAYAMNRLPWNDARAAAQNAFLEQLVGEERRYVIGYSDGTAPPTVDSATGVITLPATRSYDQFLGSYGGFSTAFAANDAARITANVSIVGVVDHTPRTT